jgi:hypothetical protein
MIACPCQVETPLEHLVVLPRPRNQRSHPVRPVDGHDAVGWSAIPHALTCVIILDRRRCIATFLIGLIRSPQSHLVICDRSDLIIT